MGWFLSGVLLLAAVLGLFHLKDELRSPWLARLAYSEPVMRLAVVAVVLILAGALLTLSRWLGGTP